MPNHCTNILQLESGESLTTLLEPYLEYKGDNEYDFHFQKIIPMDEKLLEGENWYNWRVKNWGTKWEGYSGRFNEDGTSFSFDTAWAPPLPVIEMLSKLSGQTFIMEYIEEGMFFCGRFTVTPEDSCDEFYDDIEKAPKELKDALGYQPWEE